MTGENRKRKEQISSDLEKLVKGEVLADIFNRVAFSTDASIYQIMPVCIVAVLDAEDISAVVKYAARNNIPLAARGAGSGVAGESLTEGIVIDTSRYMNTIIGINDDASVVTSQPGVVLDELNNYLKQYSKMIGPDPSSSDRACIGAVVANNATGAHSLQYGYIAEYVESAEIVLADGTICRITNNDDPAILKPGPLGDIAEKCIDLLSNADKVIEKALPKTKRDHSGYNIAGVCTDSGINLAKLLAGSEGTLGIFTEVSLRTVDIPKAKALLQLEFKTLKGMARAVPLIVKTHPGACELMDRTLIKMALQALPQYSDIFPMDCAALLLVEHTGENEDQVKRKIEETDSAVGKLAKARKVVFDAHEQERLWKSRKDAVPLLHREKGQKHPLPFIEDVSVGCTRLGKYISGLEKISERYRISMAYYGHAGDGELHIRPYLDLSRTEDVGKMVSIADDVFDLAWSLGGSISGEHADGLVRAAFINRQFGDEYYELLRKIKNIFDPAGIMNPGKILNEDPNVMTNDLRASGTIHAERLMTNLKFSPRQYRYEIEQCSGDGVCLSLQPGMRMCPVFRAVGEEIASPRAKANILRAWITGILESNDFKSRQFKRILELCINCKMCSVQCPSGVDISRLIVEARAEYARRKGFTAAEFVLSRSRYVSIMGSLFAPLSNFIMAMPWFRALLEKLISIDRRRELPKFQRSCFLAKGRKFLAKEPKLKAPVDKVAYFVDSFANYNDHELAFAVIKFLRHCNIDVILPRQLPAPLPAFNYGDLRTARKDMKYNVNILASAVRSGYKIICSEPSAALFLKEELKLLISGRNIDLVSGAVFELMDYLNTLGKVGRLQLEPPNLNASPVAEEFTYHNPCHLCALGASGASIELLSKLTDVKITDINAGCCGLAGTVGLQKKNYDLSVTIAKEMTDALEKIDTEFVMTECSACKMQIEHLTNKKVYHPIKVLAQVYGLL